MKERFEFTQSAKKTLLFVLVSGVVLSLLGTYQLINADHGHNDTSDLVESTTYVNDGYSNIDKSNSTDGDYHPPFHWYQRIYSNIWINILYFMGISISAIFFVAIQYVSQAGWSAGIIRVPLAIGRWLPIGGILMIVAFLVTNHDIFHWTHDYLYDPEDPRYDYIIAGKQAYLNFPFYISRMIIFIGVWYLFYRLILKHTIIEDKEGGDSSWKNLFTISTIFVVFYAFSQSVAAWDWVLSIDTHWFSTMFGWYVFASWWVSALALTTYMIILLKDNGYLSIINHSVIHDLGKFVFAFSVFWTYIWFSQFLLIYYANIPEETIYFVERLESDFYFPFFVVNIIFNFFFPFLFLMTRASKRYTRFLKIACPVVLFGHFIDFYLMVTPGVLKSNGGFGFLEIGILMIFLSGFLFVVLNGLTKLPLVAKNHPMLEESLHHDI